MKRGKTVLYPGFCSFEIFSKSLLIYSQCHGRNTDSSSLQASPLIYTDQDTDVAVTRPAVEEELSHLRQYSHLFHHYLVWRWQNFLPHNL